MKQEITEEDYKKIIDRLTFIENEKRLLETLNKEGTYQAHITLSASFGELIINLKRENEYLDRTIKLEKKLFLEEFSTNKELYKMLKEKIEQLIASLSLEKPIHSIDDPEFFVISNNYPSFLSFIERVKELTSKKSANNFLLNYIRELDEEQDSMLSQKFQYERKRKKEARKGKLFQKQKTIEIKRKEQSDK